MSGALGPGEFALGCAVLGAILGATGVSALLVVRRRFAGLHGAPRVLAIAVLWIAGVLAVEIVPLALGILSLASVVAASGLLLLIVSRSFAAGGPDRTAGSAEPSPEATPWRSLPMSVGSISVLLAAGLLLLTVAWWLAYLQRAVTYQPVSVDALAFHLPGVIRFLQTGSLWHIAQYLPGQAQGNYPQNGDLLLLAVVLPWRSVSLVRYVDPVMLAIAALAIYAIGRELRAPATTSVIVALAVVALRPALAPGLTDVLTDPTFLAGFAAGTLFLIRHWRTGARSELVLAGAGLGIALGTKWYGLTDVPALIAVWIVAALVCGRRRGLAADAGALIAATLVVGGVWLIRNLVLTANPVFNYKVSLVGATIFAAPPDPIRKSIGYSLAHYAGDTKVLRKYVWPVFRKDFGLTTALIWLGALGTGAVALVGRLSKRASARTDPRLMILLAGALLIVVAYANTPYSAQGFDGAPVLVAANTRYGVPALILAAPLLAWLAGRLGLLRLAVEAVLAVCVFVNLNRHLGVGTGRIILSALVVLALFGLWRAAPALARRVRSPWRAWAALAAGLACACALLAYHYQRVLGHRAYAPADPTVSYVLATSPEHTRIGITGQWLAQGLIPVAPLFGPRLRNQVSYVGHFVDHRLEQYRAPAQFVAALRRGHFRYLEVGTGFPPNPDPPAARWARAAGFSVLTASNRLILMRAPAS